MSVELQSEKLVERREVGTEPEGVGSETGEGVGNGAVVGYLRRALRRRFHSELDVEGFDCVGLCGVGLRCRSWTKPLAELA